MQMVHANSKINVGTIIMKSQKIFQVLVIFKVSIKYSYKKTKKCKYWIDKWATIGEILTCEIIHECYCNIFKSNLCIKPEWLNYVKCYTCEYQIANKFCLSKIENMNKKENAKYKIYCEYQYQIFTTLILNWVNFCFIIAISPFEINLSLSYLG